MSLNPPTNVSATRNSDTNFTITWTNHSGTADGTVYKGITVFRRAMHGSAGGGVMPVIVMQHTVQSPQSIPTSFVDTTTSGNDAFSYQVRAESSTPAGLIFASSLRSPWVYTSPEIPGPLTVTRISATQVRVSGLDQSSIEDHYEWQVSTDNFVTVTPAGTTPALPNAGANVVLIHTPPAASQVWYRVRAVRGTLVSPVWQRTASPISGLAPPAAPTMHALPAVSSTGATLRVSWTHNSIDGSPQQQVRISVWHAGVSQPDITLTTENQWADISIAGWAAGGQVSARVATRGLHATFSPVSGWANTWLGDPPTVNITTPTAGATITGALTVAWSYASTYPQASWSLEMLDNMHNRVGLWQGTTATTHAIPAGLLANLTTYTMRLTATSSANLTTTVTRNFTTAFTPATAPSGTASFNLATLSATIVATAGPTGGLPATVRLSVERLDDDGAVFIGEHAGTSATFVDPTPPLGREVTYRVRAHTALDAVTPATTSVLSASAGRFAINFGEQLLVLDADPRRSRRYEPGGEQLAFAGRTLPVHYAATSRTVSVDLTASTVDPATVATARLLGRHSGTAVYRSPDGDRHVVAVTEVDVSDTSSPVAQIALSMTQVSA